jgi:hypothetical protein
VPIWSHPTHGPRNSFARPCWNSDAASGYAARVILLRGIQKALFDMALPYGFSLVVWGSGTIITRSRGTPHVGDVFLGALGVVIAYGALQFLGRRADEPADEQLGSADRPIVGGAGHVLAIAGGLGAAALLGEISSWFAWPLAFFAATTVYLVGSGVTLGILTRIE